MNGMCWIYRGDRTLLITEYIIEQRSYNDVYKETTWADCSIRRYLNGEFYDRFTENDKLRICSVINKNPANPWYKTGGGANTQDRIFLLSMEEIVCRYFGDSSQQLYHPKKNQRYCKCRIHNTDHACFLESVFNTSSARGGSYFCPCCLLWSNIRNSSCCNECIFHVRIWPIC